MTITANETGKRDPTSGLLGWVRAIAARFRSPDELRGFDRAEFEQIARDLNLSPTELHLLSIGDSSSRDLLEKRLTEFDLTSELVKKLHPEVLRDLQRVCGICIAKARCARDFAQAKPVPDRSGYCPNTQTLEALGQEHLSAGPHASLPIGPSCC
jgi:hypothetical protein